MPTYAFDEDEDPFESMRKDMEAADARVLPWQAQIKPGDYFQRDSGYGFRIYGQILNEEEEREPDLRNYRLCKGYSVACPRGELGDIHVSTIETILS